MIRRGPSYQIKANSFNKIIYLFGRGFDYETSNGLYLSSSRFNGTEVFCDFYSSIPWLSSDFPPFSAYPVYNYVVENNNVLYFTLSAFSTPQKLDIIYAGPSGYIKASTSDPRFTYIQIVTGVNVGLYLYE